MKSMIVLSNPPQWWHPHGRKIDVKGSDLSSIDRFVILGSNTTEVSVKPVHKSYRSDSWLLEWKITHGSSTEGESSGFRIMNTKELFAAFGLNNFIGDDPSFNKFHGAHSAKPGVYARVGRHLNIPCPGSASDGDPNISIWVEETIQTEIFELVRTVKALEQR
jgi:hypothetical protein